MSEYSDIDWSCINSLVYFLFLFTHTLVQMKHTDVHTYLQHVQYKRNLLQCVAKHNVTPTCTFRYSCGLQYTYFPLGILEVTYLICPRSNNFKGIFWKGNV